LEVGLHTIEIYNTVSYLRENWKKKIEKSKFDTLSEYDKKVLYT